MQSDCICCACFKTFRSTQTIFVSLVSQTSRLTRTAEELQLHVAMYHCNRTDSSSPFRISSCSKTFAKERKQTCQYHHWNSHERLVKLGEKWRFTHLISHKTFNVLCKTCKHRFTLYITCMPFRMRTGIYRFTLVCMNNLYFMHRILAHQKTEKAQSSRKSQMSDAIARHRMPNKVKRFR